MELPDTWWMCQSLPWAAWELHLLGFWRWQHFFYFILGHQSWGPNPAPCQLHTKLRYSCVKAICYPLGLVLRQGHIIFSCYKLKSSSVTKGGVSTAPAFGAGLGVIWWRNKKLAALATAFLAATPLLGAELSSCTSTWKMEPSEYPEVLWHF